MRSSTAITCSGLVPQVICGAMAADVDRHLAVELRAGVARQLAPGRDGAVPHGALGRELPALDIGVGRVVGGDEAHLGAELDREVADGEPALDAAARGWRCRRTRPHSRCRRPRRSRRSGAGSGPWASRPAAISPSKVARNVFGRRCTRVCVASTCASSLEPMPKASAPMPPCVQVWLSPHTMRQPGRLEPQLGPHHVHDALAGLVDVEEADAGLARLRRAAPRAARCRPWRCRLAPARWRWRGPGVANVRCGLCTVMPRRFRSSRPREPPRSCSRCRSTCSR